MDEVIRTLRYAVRSLRGSPGFTAVAVTTLALGIGVNAAIFSLVSAVLFRPLPVESPDRLVNVYGHTVTAASHDALSYPNFMDLRAQAETLDGVMAHVNFFANLSIRGSSELVVGELVSRDYFRVLGVSPALGRSFVDEEFAAAGAGPVAILSHSFWQTRFGGDPEILGRTFRMNGVVYTAVGVAPREFGGMFPAVTAQMWVPLSMVDQVEPIGNQRFTGGPRDGWLETRGRHFLWIKARMRPGVELPAVRTELEAIAARISEQYPESSERERVTVLRTSDVAINPDFDGTVAPAGLVLLGAVGLVLLVACANLANMMLARATANRRDHALRLALGAGRRRLVGQLLAESTLVALAGGAVALVLATWLTGVVSRFQPPLPIDIGLDIAPDWRVLAFTFAAALITGVAFGLVPALRASRPDLVPALKDLGDGGTGRGRRRIELRDALVVSQVALSLTLLVVGALMARSLGEAARVDLGYDAHRTGFLALALEMNGYDREGGGALVESGRQRLAALPEVEAVGLASRVPQSLNNNGFGLFIDGHPSTAADRPIVLDGAYVDEHYLDALGLELLRGRWIEPADRDDGRRVAVISQTMARDLWPGEDALDREFRLGRDGEPYRVVGIAEDYKVDTPGEAPKPYLHLPLRRDLLFANYLVRTATPADRLVPALERELRALDPDLVFLETGTLQDLADVRTFPIRAGAWLIGVFGVLALLLAAVGLYGVIAFAVSRRVREIGIRKALGAESGAVVGLVLRRGMALVAIGGAVGAALAAAGGSLLGSVLYVGAFDPLSFLAAFTLLALVAALAHWVPAHRAARVDPMVALRGE